MRVLDGGESPGDPGRDSPMHLASGTLFSNAEALTADDLLPLVPCLDPKERARLFRLITGPAGADAAAYRAVPPARDEFSTDEDPLSWEAEGWENVG